MAIPRVDTALYVVGRGGDPCARVEGRKQGGVVCVALSALPPPGLGEPKSRGADLERSTSETLAMDAVKKALLEFTKMLQDVGYQGSSSVGELVEGCMAMVFLGAEMSVFEYSSERGLYELPGGIEYEVKKEVDANPRVPWPPLPGSEQKWISWMCGC